MDNPLKRSFDLNYKEKEDNTEEKIDHETAFDQEDGATSFLKEQSNPFSEEETQEEDGGMDPALASALNESVEQDTGDEVPEVMQEDETEEVDRGAVEDVLAHINDDYEAQGRNENEDRGAVEDVLRSLNREGDGYQLPEGEVPQELEDNQFEAEDEEEEEMDEVVASVLDELNEDEQEITEDEEDPCWEGYTMVGEKQGENGEMVPNCVPEEDAENYDPDESLSTDDILDAVLEEEVNELHKLDQLAEQILNG